MWWGSDGELHGFASPRQFLSDGYDPAFVVTVTGLGQLGRRCTGPDQKVAAGNAFSTGADGAVINLLGRLLRIRRREDLGVPIRPSWRQCGRPTRLHALQGRVGPAQWSAVLGRRRAAYDIGHGLRELPGRPLPGSSPWLNLRVDGYSGTAALQFPFYRRGPGRLRLQRDLTQAGPDPSGT